MGFLSILDYGEKPFLKALLIILTLANAVGLAFLLFRSEELQAGTPAASEIVGEQLTLENGSEGRTEVAVPEYEIPDDLPESGPVLKLTDKKISLEVGEEFQYADYIETAMDRNGTDLREKVRTSGSVDTDTAGQYRITYMLRSRVDDKAVSRELQVTVGEGEDG